MFCRTIFIWFSFLVLCNQHRAAGLHLHASRTDPAAHHLDQWSPVLVPRAPCPACFRRPPALTHLIQMMSSSSCLCRTLIRTCSFDCGVLEQGDISNIQGRGPEDHHWGSQFWRFWVLPIYFCIAVQFSAKIDLKMICRKLTTVSGLLWNSLEPCFFFLKKATYIYKFISILCWFNANLSLQFLCLYVKMWFFSGT